VSDVPKFVDSIKRANLLTLAERPFDLKALIRTWIADRRLGSRFRVLKRIIALQLAPSSVTAASVRFDAARMHFGARMLAGAVMMTGKALICLPEGVHSTDRITHA
jgi:hypothetical protein